MKSSILYKSPLFAAILSLSLGSTAFSELEESRYPLRIVDRPGIMPTGIVEFMLNTGLGDTLKTFDMDVHSKFGLVEDLEASLSWDGLSADIQAKQKTHTIHRTVNLGFKYNYFNLPHISFSSTLKIPLHILDGEILRDITIGLPVVFYNNLMAGGILGNLFKLTMRDRVACEFNFEWWYGIQACGNLWLSLDSSVGRVALENKAHKGELASHGFWEKLPLNLSATYAFSHYFDLGANVGLGDAFDAKNTFKFGLTFTTRAGRLFG